MPRALKGLRTQLTVDEKRQLACQKVQTGHCEELVAEWFKNKTRKEVHRSVVGKSVRAGFHKLNVSSADMKRHRRRGARWPLLDEGLFTWFRG